ncbi:hypothetical protein [Nocardia wallacei]|uniref:hypothetical protein n=1 Tax=Nocardia wallacei TaxID=480035 RepID=UPI002458E12C|nr:hypothetical protein [Nocardia wallacei]
MGILERAERERLAAELTCLQRRVAERQTDVDGLGVVGIDDANALRDALRALQDAYAAVTSAQAELHDFDVRYPPSTVDRALADMREGRKVMVIAVVPNHDGLTPLLNKAVDQLLDGERAYSSRDNARITAPGGGWIAFRTVGGIQGGGGRGLELDRVYIDHAELMRRIAPAVMGDRSAIVMTGI